MRTKLFPSPAMVVAVTALVLAAGGTSYAVSQLPAGSVGTKQIKGQAVKSQKLGYRAVTRTKLADASVTGMTIAPNSVTGGHVMGNSLTGYQVDESTLGVVPKATSAGIEGLTFESARRSLDPGDTGPAHVDCPAGSSPVSGGVRLDNVGSMITLDSYPSGRGWTAEVANFGGSNAGFAVHAVCAHAGGVQAAG